MYSNIDSKVSFESKQKHYSQGRITARIMKSLAKEMTVFIK